MALLNINKSILYVASGTGNTYRVASKIKEILTRLKKKTDLIMIDDAQPAQDLKEIKEIKEDNNLLLGVLFPAHGFLPPWSMIKFLLKLPVGKGTAAFCAATRGALKFGPVLVPGASGFGTFFAAIVMTLKGYRVKGIFSVDMPANIINAITAQKQKTREAISLIHIKKVENWIPRMVEGKKIFFTRNNIWEACWSVLLLGFIPLFPIVYLLFGRISMAKVMFSNNRCVGCGLCAKACPCRAIVMKKSGSRKYPFWTYHCEVCMRCMGFCNKQAVEAGHSWAIVLYFIFTIPLFATLLNWLYSIFYVIPVFYGYWGRELLSGIYYFPALFISYFLFWYMIRIPLLNKLFTFSTLTHYYRRYHEPDTRVKDLLPKS